MTIFVAIDDTDSLNSRGTGRLARAIAGACAERYPLHGVTRHQLLVHEAVPYTSHNSCAVIQLRGHDPAVADHAGEIAEQVMMADFVEGSDPGLCWATDAQVTPSLVAFGQDAQRIVLDQERARTLARNLGITLRGLGGTEDGVIGALAGIGLASTQNDGRYLMYGRVREMVEPCPVSDLIASGVDAIYTLDGREVTGGTIEIQNRKGPLACPIGGRAILFVDEVDGMYVPIKRN
ncbi:MAG: ABC transporter substrate-binding protein [Methanospirillum sp.]|nr:ABC transporter substrate-binding protein [Methanospirillum sp.]